MSDYLRLIDLTPSQVGALCLLCQVMGFEYPARFRDALGGPVCESCFTDLLKRESQIKAKRGELEESGSLCVWCDSPRAAHLIHAEHGPLCATCYGAALNVDVRLRWEAIQEGQRP